MAGTKSEGGRPSSPRTTTGTATEGDPFGALLGSPILWGIVATFGFYAALPHLPVQRELMIRYFCSHPLEYATTGLFLVGVTVLLFKGLRSLSESSAFGRIGGLASPGTEGSDPQGATGTAERLGTRVDALPGDLRRSWLATRIADVCSYVCSRRSTSGLEEHLKYLAEVAAERLHGSYALIRTITWAVPILGFLGTVIGITIAIANVTPEQLDTSLGEVTGGLAVAFDTTALALALSLVLVFASFLVERAEQQVLARVEDHGVRELMALFPEEEQSSPLVEAERRAAEQLLQRTETLVESQVRAWDESLEAMRARWHETIAGQQSQLETALESGVAGTLAEHDRQLKAVREEFVRSFEGASAALVAGLEQSRATQSAMQGEFTTALEGLRSRVAADLSDLHDRQATRVDGMVESIADRLGDWLTRLDAVNEAAAGQREELTRQGELLARVVAGEEELARLQQRLGENLEAVRAAETFEQALHELTAAVHLLTARAKPRAA